MGKLEAIATSPYFAIALIVLGTWLFVLLTREFSFWFFRIRHFENELTKIQTTLTEIKQNSSATPSIQAVTEKKPISAAPGLPPIPTATEPAKQQFPVQH
ncbi:MAG: hypothetical protein AB7F59_12270 [Bdellovibrionales bacterium]